MTDREYIEMEKIRQALPPQHSPRPLLSGRAPPALSSDTSMSRGQPQPRRIGGPMKVEWSARATEPPPLELWELHT